MMPDFAKLGDWQELKGIYGICFPQDGEAFWDMELTRRVTEDNLLVWRENGKILSCVQLLPESLSLDGCVYPAQYIYAAATLPEAQGRGLMGKLLKTAHALAAQRGQQFSVLITQNDDLFAFYARFGYLDWAKTGILRPAPGKQTGRLRPMEPGDVPAVLALYDRERQGILSVDRARTHLEQQRQLYGADALVLEQGGAVTAAGFRTGHRLLEIVGPEKAALLAASDCKEGQTLPMPGQSLRRNGCVLPLDAAAAELLRRVQPIYLNLMWN